MAKKAFVYDGTNWIDIAQSTADLSTYQKSNRTGLQLIVPTSVTGGTLGANGQISFSGSSSVTIDNAFTSAYDNYKIVGSFLTSTAAYINLRVRSGGTTRVSGYRGAEGAGGAAFNSNEIRFGYSYANAGNFSPFEQHIANPAIAGRKTQMYGWQNGIGDSSMFLQFFTAFYNTAETNEGLVLFPGAGTMTGEVRIYGYNNGV